MDPAKAWRPPGIGNVRIFEELPVVAQAQGEVDHLGQGLAGDHLPIGATVFTGWPMEVRDRGSSGAREKAAFASWKSSPA
jgi:hypothetical protein